MQKAGCHALDQRRRVTEPLQKIEIQGDRCQRQCEGGGRDPGRYAAQAQPITAPAAANARSAAVPAAKVYGNWVRT